MTLCHAALLLLLLWYSLREAQGLCTTYIASTWRERIGRKSEQDFHSRLKGTFAITITIAITSIITIAIAITVAPWSSRRQGRIWLLPFYIAKFCGSHPPLTLLVLSFSPLLNPSPSSSSSNQIAPRSFMSHGAFIRFMRLCIWPPAVSAAISGAIPAGPLTAYWGCRLGHSGMLVPDWCPSNPYPGEVLD